MGAAMEARQGAEAGARMIRRMSILSLALLAPFAAVVILIQAASSSTSRPATCHTLLCGEAFASWAVVGSAALCLLGPTLGGLLAGALAWMESVRQAARQQQALWLIGLLLAGVVVMAPILALMVAAVTANTRADQSPVLPFDIPPAWDIALVPLLAIVSALITLLFAIVGDADTGATGS